MNILFISDTHTYHDQIHIPINTDLIICCGDEANHQNPVFNEVESRRFFEWFSALDVEFKVFVPGNHSTAIENGLIREKDYPGVTFLDHKLCQVGGIKIFGSPYTPVFSKGWSYMKKHHRMQQVWDSVPKCDILVTHGPPQGILDTCEDRTKSGRYVQVGCKSLMNKVREIRPKVHAFGHIHDEPNCYNHGMLQRDGMTFINASSYINKSHRLNQGVSYDY